MRQQTKQGRGKTVIALAGRGMALVLLAAAVLAAVVLIIVPRATGSQSYTVLTESMRPQYPPGTFLVVKPTDFAGLKTGDVITYQLSSGEPEVVTHRIAGMGATQDGVRTVVTRGDNNSANDVEPVRAEQIRGRLLYAVPSVGLVTTMLGPAERETVIRVLAVGLVGFGCYLISRGLIDRRKRQGTGRNGREEEGLHGSHE